MESPRPRPSRGDAKVMEAVPRTLQSLIEREFPRVLGASPWLNNASTGPLPERAVAALRSFGDLRAEPWKISQDYQFGVLERCRELVGQLIGAGSDEIALMVNTSYGVNLAARSLPLSAGDVVVISDRDFPANVYPWLALERSRGVLVRKVPCAGRLFDEDALIAALDAPRVKVLAVSWVSFESGIRLDLDRLSAACRERGIFLFVDAIQGVGAATLDLRRTAVDILACGAQKWLCSPWGSGFVYVRRELVRRLEPHDVSWMAVKDSDDFSHMCDYDLTYRDDARRFEMITLPFQDFAAFSASLEVLREAGPAAAQRVESHASRLMEWALVRPDLEVVTPVEPPRRAGIISIVPSDPVATSARLERAGIGHSLREGAIRLSPHFFTPDEHIDQVMEAMSP
ncbi:MAG: aminotransferase class V-fold PLP-dependent enzyme [Gemmatimonadota bacterium]